MKRLDGKVAVITGSGRGIGKSAALLFAEEGASVVVVDVDKKNGEETISQITRQGGQALFIQADVSQSKEVRNVMKRIKGEYRKLHVIYNNASVYLPGEDGKLTDIEEKIWERVIAVNLTSIFLFCKYGIPFIIESGGGTVINTASSAGVIGIPGCDAYTASKGATVSLTRSLASEFGPRNIRVNCIAPAGIKTPMLDQSNLEDSDFDEEHFLNLRTPLRRYGRPEEIADIALFLASEESSYINGAVIVADGGITINGDLSTLKKEGEVENGI
jgi:NAD(P)-dependent dehydrogenase (short-subunit alcohol dehydrogenase family)